MRDSIIISAQTQERWQEFISKQSLSAKTVESQELVKTLWERSKYSERLCQKYPHWLSELVEVSSAPLKRSIVVDQVYQAVVEANEEESLKQCLREIRHKLLLQICWKDLVLRAEILDILQELSVLADACVKVTADWMRNSLIEKYGVPRTEQNQQVNFVVIAMGKLGGEELNFSSDIDVMFCYSDSGQSDGEQSISNQEFFTQFAQGVIRILSDVTSDGFVYRVDCRLRPFGESGPLVVNFNHVEDYLQTHGREWERYAFVKARVIYGEQRDKQKFDKIVASFVYRKYIDFGVINTLREMKDLISQQMAKKGNLNNIKLGIGGIREIEFIVQFFQLVHGGQNPRLQSRRIIEVLHEIEATGYLSTQDVNELVVAYRFLRRVENRLQMFNDEQIHVIPENQKQLQLLSESMSFLTVNDFQQALKIHTDAVNKVFAQIRSDDHQEDDYVDIWKKLSQLDECDDAQALNVSGYKEFSAVAEKIHALMNSSAYRNQDKEGRRRLNLFMPCFLRELNQVDSPALAINRLALLLQNILRRSAYLVLLYENQQVLKQLIAVASASPWIASHLTSYPLLLDELVVNSEEEYLLTQNEIKQQFASEILAYDQLDYDVILERVRLFKHARELRVACADVLNKISVMKVSDQLSWTAESLVDGCVKYLERSYDSSMKDNLAVIAFGKLGGLELSYGSDLDLVYIAQNEQQSTYLEQARVPYVVKVSKFAQRLTQMLTLQTVSGRLYDVDTRLRPDGESGSIVPSFAFVEDYYKSRAWMWELQALVRARCVSGSLGVREQFANMRKHILCQQRDNKKLALAVADMREKMLKTKASKSSGVFHLKNDEGGITDIEFMVQYAVLAHAYKDNSLCGYSDNVRLLERLAGGGFISSSMATELSDIYCRFRNIMHRIALQSGKPEAAQDEYANERKIVRDCWNKILGEK
ncbi:MAG: bifunctional [glutamate--ammonia ligase]-adenylyl-L-tyrosine phosphorylase/[glutamate--ammonia-ligase] adenylyltransferase [Gammaproteobacteria bacterium]|nr:bifunctional [glutamate--ammonia ligase]-adenylyl-L-tyrosine phosphorylase/[glutamate--ammonia-ligase] adenylyltransferase [Gammaproteobacteria bacterium]